MTCAELCNVKGCLQTFLGKLHQCHNYIQCDKRDAGAITIILCDERDTGAILINGMTRAWV